MQKLVLSSHQIASLHLTITFNSFGVVCSDVQPNSKGPSLQGNCDTKTLVNRIPSNTDNKTGFPSCSKCPSYVNLNPSRPARQKVLSSIQQKSSLGFSQMFHSADAGGEAVIVRDHDGRIQRLEIQNHHGVRVELGLGFQCERDTLRSSLPSSLVNTGRDWDIVERLCKP